MSESGAAEAPEAKAGKTDGGFRAPPPPDKPKEWKPLGVLSYKESGGVFEFRVVSAAELPRELREILHENHGIATVAWGEK